MCNHLQLLEDYLKSKKIPETVSGASVVKQWQGLGIF
jgi:hypothetical protein